MTEPMSFAERIVHAAEHAVEQVSVTVFRGVTGVESVEGYPTDLAKASASATIEALADELTGHLCCGTSPEPQCLKCGELYGEIFNLRFLADQVREVPALKATV